MDSPPRLLPLLMTRLPNLKWLPVMRLPIPIWLLVMRLLLSTMVAEPQLRLCPSSHLNLKITRELRRRQ
jgi:hypothetical protein